MNDDDFLHNFRMSVLEEMATCDFTDYKGVKAFCERNNVDDRELLYDCAAWILERVKEDNRPCS